MPVSERDIDGYVAALEGALEADDEKVGTAAAMQLLRFALIDLHRIADALELLATTR